MLWKGCIQTSDNLSSVWHWDLTAFAPLQISAPTFAVSHSDLFSTFLSFSSLPDPLILSVPLILTYPYSPGSSPSSIPTCFSKHLAFASVPFILFPFSSSAAHFLPQQSPHHCLPRRHCLYSSDCLFPPSPLPSSSLTPTELIFYFVLPVAAGEAQRQREVMKLEMLPQSPKMKACFCACPVWAIL